MPFYSNATRDVQRAIARDALRTLIQWTAENEAHARAHDARGIAAMDAAEGKRLRKALALIEEHI